MWRKEEEERKGGRSYGQCQGGDFFAPRNLWGNISLPSSLVMLDGGLNDVVWHQREKKNSIVKGAVCFFVYMRSTFYSFLVVLKHTLWHATDRVINKSHGGSHGTVEEYAVNTAALHSM